MTRESCSAVMSSPATTSSFLRGGRSRKASIRSPSMKPCASAVFRSLTKERHDACESPPTPLTTRASAVCTFASRMYSSCGSEATTPTTPLTEPYSIVGSGSSPASRICMVREPRRKRLTNSPRWNSPTTSSRPRSSSVCASVRLRAAKRLSAFSAPRKVSSSRKATAVIQLALTSRASSVSSPADHCSSVIDFIRSPTRMKSARACTYSTRMWPQCSARSASRGAPASHSKSCSLLFTPASSRPGDSSASE
mmetsp:Transcript_40859/g.132366  ORF Transcript_40859/g.132366 Transcript_40859/m.132366 type:complete len:252 (-) Transcript_40859:738-1493(-)